MAEVERIRDPRSPFPEEGACADSRGFDARELESKVNAMYSDVAERPHGTYHFEMGRALAERLGYRAADLDRIPREAIDSFGGCRRN